jgi:hypothetical protein
MPSLQTLPRVWPATELPGYRDHPARYATYSMFAYDELPPIERRLDDEFCWLLREPIVETSLADVHEPAAATPATADALAKLIAERRVTLPRSFSVFMASDGPRARIRSCTDCYLDLADFALPVHGGGMLIHFLSDSQWVLHWLLYCGDDGSEAVVVTDRPLGFELDPGEHEETVSAFDPEAGGGVCAESFAEFVYRFWIENEIWFAVSDRGTEARPLTDEQRRYAEHYAHR